jgi:hypothetical protein
MNRRFSRAFTRWAKVSPRIASRNAAAAGACARVDDRGVAARRAAWLLPVGGMSGSSPDSFLVADGRGRVNASGGGDRSRNVIVAVTSGARASGFVTEGVTSFNFPSRWRAPIMQHMGIVHGDRHA